MRNRGRRLYQSLTRAQVFARDSSAVQAHPALSKLFAELTAQTVKIDKLMVLEAGARMSRSTPNRQVQALKEKLRKSYLKVIVTRGRQRMLSKPGADRALRMPKARDSADKVVAAARAILKIAAPERKLFADVVPPDFFKQAKALTDELARDSATRHRNRTGLTQAIRNAEVEIRRGREVIEMMSAIIEADAVDTASWRSTWRNVTRVGPRIGRPLKKKQGPAS